MLKNRLTAFILFVTMLSIGTILPSFEVDASDKSETQMILNALGIDAVDSDGYITRGDYTVLMVQAAGIAHEGMSSDMFEDVEGEWSEYIAAAANMGYIKGMEAGKFYPEKIISVKDAYTLALRVLGYKNMIGTTMEESLIDMLDLNESVPLDGNLKCSDANTLIMNMLEAGYAVNNKSDIEVSEETFMYKTHGVHKARGTINGVKGISLSDYPDVKEYEICIDNVVYENETDISYDYLGSTGTVYVKEYDDYNSVIYFRGNPAKMYTLTSEKIEDVYGFDRGETGKPYITFELSETKTKTENIDKNALVYINRVNTVGVSDSDFMPQSGVVTLIDSDDDGSSDTVIIEKYDYYVVDTVDYTAEVIYSDNERPDINLSKFFERDVNIIYDGTKSSLDEVKSGIVLSVMCTYDSEEKIDANQPIVIEILNSSINGTVKSISQDGTITIDGIEYRYTEIFDEKPEVGKTGTYYLGKLGEIVYWEDNKAADGLEYGYLLRIISDDVEEKTHVTIFDTKGKKHKLMVDDVDKVKFSGILDDNYVTERRIWREDFDALFDAKQLVRFGYDGERLTRIHKAVDGTLQTDYAGYDEDKFSLDHKSNNERLYAQFLSENYKISTQTIMVGVSKNGDSDEDVVLGGYDILGTDVSGMNIQIYDSDKKFVPAVVVTLYDNIDSAAKKPSANFVNTKFAALITRKYSVVNSDNDIVSAYEAYCGGVKVKIEPENEELYDVKGTNWSGEGKRYFNELQPGDVIQYGTNSEGRVNILHVIHDHSSLTSRYTMFNSNDHLSEMNTAFGKVTEYVSGSYFKLDSSQTRKYPFGRYNPNIYLYDVSAGTYTRLLTLPNLSEDDYVFVRCARADIKDIIIYRNE